MEDILPRLLQLGRDDDDDDDSLLDNSSFGRDKAIQSGGESNLDTPLCKGVGSQHSAAPWEGEIVLVFLSVTQGHTQHTLAPCMLANYYQPPSSQVRNGQRSAAGSLANQPSSASRKRWLHLGTAVLLHMGGESLARTTTGTMPR